MTRTLPPVPSRPDGYALAAVMFAGLCVLVAFHMLISALALATAMTVEPLALITPSGGFNDWLSMAPLRRSHVEYAVPLS